MKLLHILNPVEQDLAKDLGFAQSVTFESQHRARKNLPHGLHLMHAAVGYRDEKVEIPSFFNHYFALSRSVMDVVATPFSEPRRLPLIADIMALAGQIEADYYLYTNIDIALQPNFYAFVHHFLQQGYQGLIINRRRIPFLRASYDDLSSYSSRSGRTHPGFDCFVMSARVVRALVLEKICVGVPFIGVAMAHNIFAYARPWRLFAKEDLTFHLGMEVYPPQIYDYYWHNRRQFFRHVKPRLWPTLSVEAMPYGLAPWWSKCWHWGLNPSLFVGMNASLELRRLWASIGSGRQ